MMPDPRAFWVDEHFDREHAPDGRSRYDAHITAHLGDFARRLG